MAEISEPKKSKYSKYDLMHMGREDLVNRFLNQQSQVDVEYLNDQLKKLNKEIIELKDVNVKFKNKINEQNLKEAMLAGKLERKDQEINDLLAQLHDIKQLQMPSSVQLQSCTLDPAVNVVIQNLTKDLETCKDALKLAQENLEASKFTPDSQLGKRLVEKIRVLQKENEELGQMIKTGSIAKLESELSLKQSVIDSSNIILEGMKSELEEDEEIICGLELVITNLTNELRLSVNHVDLLQQEL
ncbi:hypothetical protein HELRODRAFT_64451, partial [Helobdella robusta]|uniref:Uncharacterized protein n=1 Tax=Helobdella robusta TaxID=6412 RepID=T1FXV2_HELRO